MVVVDVPMVVTAVILRLGTTTDGTTIALGLDQYVVLLNGQTVPLEPGGSIGAAPLPILPTLKTFEVAEPALHVQPSDARSAVTTRPLRFNLTTSDDPAIMLVA
jgi:hypothetical protein